MVEPSLVVQLRKANPCATLTEIAAQVGLSKERVRQVLAHEGLPTRNARPPKHACRNCGKRLPAERTLGLCGECRQSIWTYADLPCVSCGTIVHRRISDIMNAVRAGGHGRVFCNRQCMGRWRGLNYGWGRKTLPETRLLRKLAVGQTLRVRCRWNHLSRCQGTAWWRKVRPEMRGHCHCAQGWVYVTLDGLRQSGGTAEKRGGLSTSVRWAMLRRDNEREK